MRRYLVFAPAHFAANAKTAHGVIRYGTDHVVAVVDPTLAGKTVRELLPHLASDAPIVATVRDGLHHSPSALLIGTAPQGGQLPLDWRAEILVAIDAGLEIVSGLHEMLGADIEFSARAAKSGTRFWDVRSSPEVRLFSGEAYDVPAPVLLTVGSDCAVGKMTVSLELARAATDRGKRSVFVPTGQTGMIIAGWGTAVDRVISDFASGAVEGLVLRAAASQPDCIIVEGQGGINHPAYGAVTLALLHGAAPDALLLVAQPGRERIEGFGTPTLAYRKLIAIYKTLCAAVKPAPVAGIALNTLGLSHAQAIAEIARARDETNLPVDDVVRFGPHVLYDAIAEKLTKRRPLAAEVLA
ncbi:MAG: DUF1611 domain-containing protein [Candidatus Eremiobacteraeota bacterium]|nr:DUF1611 domain-containing protein [Candidatus Eremiobacteraeota bacterium]